MFESSFGHIRQPWRVFHLASIPSLSRYLRCREDPSITPGTQFGLARACHRVRTLRNSGCFAAWRLARRPIGRKFTLLGGRPALRHRGAGLGFGPNVVIFIVAPLIGGLGMVFPPSLPNLHCGDRTEDGLAECSSSTLFLVFDRSCLEQSACRHRMENRRRSAGLLQFLP
jgi:hypothetical protein